MSNNVTKSGPSVILALAPAVLCILGMGAVYTSHFVSKSETVSNEMKLIVYVLSVVIIAMVFTMAAMVRKIEELKSAQEAEKVKDAVRKDIINGWAE